MARKTNVTGIKGLSLGSTKNNRGYSMTRYTVNYKTEEGKPKAKSFYFGRNCNQLEAYAKACEFMIEIDMIDKSLDTREIYSTFCHKDLV